MRLRQSLLIVVIGYGYFLMSFALWRRGSELPTETKFVFACSLFVAIIGALLSKHDYGLWTMTISMAAQTIYFVVDPIVTMAWFQLSVLVAIITLACVFLYANQRMWFTVLSIFLLALFNFSAYYSEQISLLRSGSFLARGSISSLMILATGLYSLYGWNQMILRAKVNDSTTNELLANIEMLERAEASQKFWRSLVIRVHETTLNTIRSILTLKESPIERYHVSIEKMLNQDLPLMNKAQERRSGSVIGAIRAGIDGAALEEKVRIVSQGVNLHLDSQVADVVERAVREALRNATEHARAKNIEIHWRTNVLPTAQEQEREHGRLFLTISDDGLAHAPQKFGGIGTNLIMAKSIRDLGGSLSIDTKSGGSESGTVIRMEMPTVVEPIRSGLIDFPSFSAIDLGRYMALLTLFGPAITGLYFFPILGFWWSGQVLTQILGFTSLAYLLYRTFFRVKQMGWLESITIALGLLGIVYFLDLDPLTCTGAQPIQWVFNSVGYGLFIIFLWGKWPVTLIAFPIFLYLVAPIHDLVPDECNFIFNIPILNSTFSFLFVAVIFTVVYKTFERLEVITGTRRERNTELVSQVVRNDTAFEKILELNTRAQESIRELTRKSGLLSIEDEHMLRRIDSQLRAEMQVDPASSSGFTLLACDFVNAVVANNHWIEVKSIHGDEDPREVPKIVRDRFLALAAELSNGSSIQVVAEENQSEISLRYQGVLTDAVAKLKEAIELQADEDLTFLKNSGSSNETVLIMRRKRSSQ